MVFPDLPHSILNPFELQSLDISVHLSLLQFHDMVQLRDEIEILEILTLSLLPRQLQLLEKGADLDFTKDIFGDEEANIDHLEFVIEILMKNLPIEVKVVKDELKNSRGLTVNLTNRRIQDLLLVLVL